MEYSPNNITNCPNYNKKAQITLKVAKKMSNCPNPMEYSPNNIINCPNYNKKAQIPLKVAQNNVKNCQNSCKTAQIIPKKLKFH